MNNSKQCPDPSSVLEAILFSSLEPLSATVLSRILGKDINPPASIKLLTEQLNCSYQKTGRSFRVVQLGDRFQLRTLSEYQTWLQKALPLKPIKLSDPTMEVLAVIAYRQPTTRAEIEFMRGVDVSNILRGLLEKNLIKIAGKDTAPGRPILYKTSQKFLSLFNLQSLQDLPDPQDLGWSYPPLKDMKVIKSLHK